MPRPPPTTAGLDLTSSLLSRSTSDLCNNCDRRPATNDRSWCEQHLPASRKISVIHYDDRFKLFATTTIDDDAFYVSEVFPATI
jgi:hypothetical protein